MELIQPEDYEGQEWAEWMALSPAQRWKRTEKLWAIFFALGGSLDALGGSLDPEPDPQSPFFDEQSPRESATDGRSGLRVEFSHDSDFAVLCEPENLERLEFALEELQATRVYVPAMEAEYLQRGHGAHF